METYRAAGLWATFIVLSPGPADELRKVRKRTEFPYPFVEDKGLAKKLKLQIAADQIQPAIFAVNKKRKIAWMQLGRNGSYYGDKELQKYLDCEFELALQF